MIHYNLYSTCNPEMLPSYLAKYWGCLFINKHDLFEAFMCDVSV